jgi:hypothetical protein
VETDDGIIEVDRMHECDRSSGLYIGDGFVGLAAGQENEEHGDECGGALHASVAVDEHLFAGVIFGGESIDGLEGPETCISYFFRLKIIVERNTVFCDCIYEDKRDILRTIEDGLNTM